MAVSDWQRLTFFNLRWVSNHTESNFGNWLTTHVADDYSARPSVYFSNSYHAPDYIAVPASVKSVDNYHCMAYLSHLTAFVSLLT